MPDNVLIVSVVCLVILAVAHSVLGEWRLLGRFLAAEGATRFHRDTLRLAWHATSVAWLGLAATLFIPSAIAPSAVAVVMGVSGAVSLIGTRGRHLSWLFFFVGSLAALHAVAPSVGSPLVSIAAGLALAFIGLLHVAWGLGFTKWGVQVAIPTRDGVPLFRPNAVITVLVGIGCLVLSATVFSLGSGLPVPAARLIGIAAAVVFALRTIGDFRLVGLFKKETSSAFAVNDTALYTPLCFALSASFVWVTAAQ